MCNLLPRPMPPFYSKCFLCCSTFSGKNSYRAAPSRQPRSKCYKSSGLHLLGSTWVRRSLSGRKRQQDDPSSRFDASLQVLLACWSQNNNGYRCSCRGIRLSEDLDRIWNRSVQSLVPSVVRNARISIFGHSQRQSKKLIWEFLRMVPLVVTMLLFGWTQ